MSNIDFLPRRLDRAFDRLAFPESAKALFAMQQGNPAYVNFWEDFVGTRSGTWPAGTPFAATVGTGTEVIGITQAVGGTMTLTTGGTSGNTAGQGLGLNWKGDNGVYFIARAKLDTITSSKIEIGLTDAVTDDGAVDVKATPTFTATDCAVFVRDTTENTTVAFVTNGGAVDGDADWSGTFEADTFYTFEIVVSDNTATGYINGQLVGSGGIEGGNALTPWFYVETLTTGTRTLTVDYVGCVGPRF